MATKNKQRSKPKQKHLGRGLQSLIGPIISDKTDNEKPLSAITGIPNFPPDKGLQRSLRDIPIKDITANPYQPRTTWDETQLCDLADSIKANGVIQPIIVRPAAMGFELIAGERRFRAAQMVGLDQIPALVRQATDEQMLEWALVENIHRTDLNPIERAKAYQNYINTFSLSQTEAAEKLGENRSVVTNHIRLLDLPQEIKQMLLDGRLTMGHARAILALPTDELRAKLANRALVGRLSVREVERLVRKYLTDAGQKQKPIRSKPAHILDLEDKLTRILGTKVSIDTRKNGQRGKIIIDFFSLDEFDRITEAIGLESLETA